MAYGDGHADAVAKDIAEILRKSQAKARERESARSKRDYNAGLHFAAMLVHARAVAANAAQRGVLDELEKAIEFAKVAE